MTTSPIRVDFYLIPEKTADARRLFACRLIDKAYRQGHRIYVYVNQAEAQSVDDYLWTFKDTSFVPHSLDDESLPVRVGYTEPSPEWSDLLVNLTQEMPAFFNQFRRVAEIAPDDTAWRSHARKQYKQYREKGCELESHQL